MITRHQFLAMLHDLLKPKVYLEIGVQYGLSLDLASAANVAIGVDPAPLVAPKGNQIIFKNTSNDYFHTFAAVGAQHRPVDLAFIDGSHLAEDAYQDFVNVVGICGPRSVIVFDDVLPYNQAIASREPLPGDWTGDVWKVLSPIKNLANELGFTTAQVDTFPTGTFVVWGLEHDTHRELLQGQELGLLDHYWTLDLPVPDDVINRTNAREPSWVIDRIREELCASQ